MTRRIATSICCVWDRFSKAIRLQDLTLLSGSILCQVYNMLPLISDGEE